MVKKAKQGIWDEPLGQRFGRPDIERCDIFLDPGFMDWGRYSGTGQVFRSSVKKGAQMYSGVPSGGHKKCALQALSGYFDERFVTLLGREPFVDRWKVGTRPKIHPLDGPWIPCGPGGKHSTPGDYYGTFVRRSQMLAFSPLTKPGKAKARELINFLTNPGKKGNCGYLNICINKYPSHWENGVVDPYTASAILQSIKWKEHKRRMLNGPFRPSSYPQPYFDPNPFKDPTEGPTYVPRKEKQPPPFIGGVFYPPATPKRPGNNHDGCFDKFPKLSVPDPYITQRDAEKRYKKPADPNNVFRPHAQPKTYYTFSIVNKKVDTACNENTWLTMKPITYPQFNS